MSRMKVRLSRRGRKAEAHHSQDTGGAVQCPSGAWSGIFEGHVDVANDSVNFRQTP